MLLVKGFDMDGSSSSSKVLIVDDETAIADTLAMIFKSHRYEARVAYSAEEAIETIASWQPDLAILDVLLPNMNGIDLAITTKINYPSCRVLLFSGNSNTGQLLEEAAKKGHSFEILAKPVHPELMLETASHLLMQERAPEQPKFD
jgi:DNA-binding NtrC family response regulator